MVFIFGGTFIALPSLHFVKAMLLDTAADLDPVRIKSIVGYRECDSNCSLQVFCDTFCTDCSFGKLIQLPGQKIFCKGDKLSNDS